MASVELPHSRRRRVAMSDTGVRKLVSSWVAKLQDWRTIELNHLTLFRTILFYIGLWPRENDHHGFGGFYRKYLPWLIYANFNYAMTLGFPVVIFESVYADGVQPLLESVATLFAAALMYAHIYCLLFQKDKLKKVFEELDVMRTVGKRLPYRPVAIMILNMRWTEFVIFAMVMCGLIISATGIIILPKLFFTRKFGFNEWYPFDTYKSPAYEVLFTLITFRLIYLITMVVVLYMIIWGMLVETVGEYRILSYNLEKVRRGSRRDRAGTAAGVADRYLRIDSDVDTLGSVVDEEVRKVHGMDSQRLRHQPTKARETDLEVLKKCVQHHQAMIRFVNVWASTFEVIMVVHIICTLVPTGLGIALILNAHGMEEKVIMIIALIVGCYLLLAVICLFADKITEQDEDIRDTIYGCDWHRASESFKRSMRIIMSHSNQPLSITLAGFIPLNRENFFSTMKLTYSYTMTMITQFKQEAVPEANVGA